MKIRRLVKANEPNPNTKCVIYELEDELKKFFKSSNYRVPIVYSSETIRDPISKAIYSNPIGIATHTNPNENVLVVTNFDEEFFEVEYNGSNKDLFKLENGIITNYKIGILGILSLETHLKCNTVIGLYMHKVS